MAEMRAAQRPKTYSAVFKSEKNRLIENSALFLLFHGPRRVDSCKYGKGRKNISAGLIAILYF